MVNKNLKNIDGIQLRLKPKANLAKSLAMRPKKNSAPSVSTTYVAQSFNRIVFGYISSFWNMLPTARQVPVMLAAAGILVAFGSGMWFALSATNIKADTEIQAQPATVDQPIILDAQLPPQNTSGVSNDELFTTPIQDLKSYFASLAQPDLIAKRKSKLAAFLKQKKSPLSSAAEVIANQEHWKLILAISFAESTLGRNCVDNNCSNIGVKPGHPAWRTYATYNNWVVDFNRLLGKKYNDWTLEQMCGVYVKPCNPNWLEATQQILTELKDQGIE